MPEIPGSTTSNLCEITPSDLAGTVGNLVNRIIALEQALGQLLGVDVSADQLSDISESLGWVTDITYLGVEGWTQTPAGTLIPPPGWDGLSGIIDGASGQIVSSGSSRICQHQKITGGTASDLPSGSSWIDVSTDLASDDLTTYLGDNYFTPGQTDPSGNVGWECLVAGVYDFILNISITAGTSAPTSGKFNSKIYKKDSIYATIAIAGGSVPDDGIESYGQYFSMSGRRKLAVGDFVNVNVNNATDGQINVTQAELVGILVRTV